MIEIVVPKDKEKLQRQIRDLENLIRNDLNEKDRMIHQSALEKLKTEL
ncbi:MAG: hypothetical protein VB130_05630 [Clostridium sp.]|nr:hypothetical protein [Clostridium sp.]